MQHEHTFTTPKVRAGQEKNNESANDAGARGTFAKRSQWWSQKPWNSVVEKTLPRHLDRKLPSAPLWPPPFHGSSSPFGMNEQRSNRRGTVQNKSRSTPCFRNCNDREGFPPDLADRLFDAVTRLKSRGDTCSGYRHTTTLLSAESACIHLACPCYVRGPLFIQDTRHQRTDRHQPQQPRAPRPEGSRGPPAFLSQ